MTKIAQPRDVRLGDIYLSKAYTVLGEIDGGRFGCTKVCLNGKLFRLLYRCRLYQSKVPSAYTSNTWCGSPLKMQFQLLMKSTR